MESTNNYGDLKNSEWAKLLDEIKNNDEEIEEAEENAAKKIEDKEALSEDPENAEIESFYGDDAWRRPPIFTREHERITVLYGPQVKQKAIEGRIKAVKEKAKQLKSDKIRIQREAFNQTEISLGEKIEKSHIQLLLSALTREHTNMIDKYSKYINNRLTALLNPLIPKRIRSCRILYPSSIRECPGFMYKTSEQYGTLAFWATPDIPCYFVQGTEQEILQENKPGLLNPIDKAVFMYHQHLKKKQDKELKYASAIIQKGVYSYFDLLKLNPFWFDILYNELKNN